MNILIAPDSFKGSLSAREAGEAIARGVKRAAPDAVCRVLPLADGGEGTAEALCAALGGVWHEATVHDPLFRPVSARFALLPDGTAVLETAEASGLARLATDERDPARTSTFGTGELIAAALDAGAKRIVLGLGGSATNDGSAGLLSALGARLTDAAGRDLPAGGLALAQLNMIDLAGLDARLRDVPIRALCDVTNPLCGARGASFTYGPQKGADAALCSQLDAALAVFGAKLSVACGRDVAAVPGAGAAGGLGAGLLALPRAELVPGFDEIARILALDDALHWADLVLTGEGRIDRTSAMGKVLSGLGARAMAAGRPVAALAGSLGPGADALSGHGIGAVMSIADGPMTLERAIADAAPLLENASARLLRTATLFR